MAELGPICLDDVRVSYGGRDALCGVSASFAPGVNVLLGRNGAGKTTLASVLAGLIAPDEGRVTVDGLDPFRDARARRLVGLAPQDLAVYPTLTVAENLQVFADLAGFDRSEGRRTINETMTALGIAGCAERRVATLSGGQQRCVHTAMALVHRPAVLICDEPTVGVDVEHRQLLLERIAAAGRAGCVVYSTHYLAEVEALQPRQVLVLDEGRVRYCGSLDGLLGRETRSVVEFRFTGPAPDPTTTRDVQRDENTLRIIASDPVAVLDEMLGPLSAAADLDSVEVRRPGLDDAFLALVNDGSTAP